MPLADAWESRSQQVSHQDFLQHVLMFLHSYKGSFGVGVVLAWLVHRETCPKALRTATCVIPVRSGPEQLKLSYFFRHPSSISSMLQIPSGKCRQFDSSASIEALVM